MSYFAAEPLIVSRLASIPGLVVKRTAEVSELAIKALGVKPTCVVAFGGDEIAESNPVALRSIQRWSVYLLARGATSERDAADGPLLHAIVKALHGWQPSADFEPLVLEGVQPDYDENLRQYLATFKTQTIVRIA